MHPAVRRAVQKLRQCIPTRTGPFTFLMIRRVWSSRNLTRTWVTCIHIRSVCFRVPGCFARRRRQQKCTHLTTRASAAHDLDNNR